MEQLYKDFEKLLKRQHDEFRKLYLPSDTTCFRVYDRQLADLPVVVERYGDYMRIDGDDSLDADRICDSVSRMTYTPLERTTFNVRNPVKGGENPAAASPEPKRIIVKEMGISFFVDLWSYRDTGLFLDHAVTRDMVRENSLGKRVLNLFCYTGSFTAAAASGGAVETLSVDLSNTYLQWLEDNLKLNGVSAPVHRTVRQDALEFLASPPEPIGRFHIIILDPPTFSNSHNMKRPFDIQKDHRWCIQRCVRLLTEEGVLFFSSNLSSFRLEKQYLAGLEVREITRETIPPGFTIKRFPHRCWMIRKRR